MATWDDVQRLALRLPQTEERSSRDGLLDWRIKHKSFAWERPLRRGDLQALGDAASSGPVLAARPSAWPPGTWRPATSPSVEYHLLLKKSR